MLSRVISFVFGASAAGVGASVYYKNELKKVEGISEKQREDLDKIFDAFEMDSKKIIKNGIFFNNVQYTCPGKLDKSLNDFVEKKLLDTNGKVCPTKAAKEKVKIFQGLLYPEILQFRTLSTVNKLSTDYSLKSMSTSSCESTCAKEKKLIK